MRMIEQLGEQAGNRNKYQLILAYIIWTFSFTIYFPLTGVPFLIKKPVLECRILENSDQIFTLCNDTQIETCDLNLYEYRINRDVSFDNFSTEFNLYCDRDIYLHFYPTLIFFGLCVTLVLFSSTADKKGRLIVLKTVALINVFNQIFFFLTPNVFFLMFNAFTNGICGLYFNLNQLLIVEFFHPLDSTMVMSIANAIFPFSGILVSIYYMFFNSWKILFIINFMLSFISCILIFKYCVESPRWLSSQFLYEDLKICLSKIALVNSKQNEFDAYIKIHETENYCNGSDLKTVHLTQNLTIIDLFSISKVGHKLTYLSLNWFITSLVFYSLIFNLEKSIDSDLYVDSIIIYMAEFISELTSSRFANIYGRKLCIQFSYVVAGVSYMFTDLLDGNLRKLLLFISAAGISSGQNIIFIYAPEMFPTSIRSMSISFCFFMSRISSTLTPLTFRLIKTSFFFGSMSVFSAVILCKLEETLGKRLEDNLDEKDFVQIEMTQKG